MKSKRWPRVQARDGEIKIAYGKIPHEAPDMVVAWGNGADKSTGRLLMNFLYEKRVKYNPDGSTEAPCLLDELTSRGYDLTTLKISIQKKPTSPETK
jgi:hypothetical protein